MGRTVLILTVIMRRGFGVAVCVEELRRRWERQGIRVVVGCSELDAHLGAGAMVVPADAGAVIAVARQIGATAVVAATSPYFEVLPAVKGAGFPCWAWEHGDPPPFLFGSDRETRAAIIARKLAEVYPRIDGVVAISDYVRRSIRWPRALVVRDGCDHVEDRGAKGLGDLPVAPDGLRIGTLFRLNAAEASYKGRGLLLDLVRQSRERLPGVTWSVMGRGSPEDARPYADLGMTVHANASDAERLAYLRGLDLFISPSQWEGFNLPLVEAAAAGTPAIAFDAGAHPEVTPLLFASTRQLLAFLEEVQRRPDLHLPHWSTLCYRYVRSRFSWDQTAADLQQILGLGGGAAPLHALPAPTVPLAARVRYRTVLAVKQAGRRLLGDRMTERLKRLLKGGG